MKVRTPKDIGAAIRASRRDQGMSQAALAERAGVGREWLVSVERGKANAGIARVLRVLTILRLDVRIASPQDAVKPVRSGRKIIDLDEHLARLTRKRSP